MSKMKLGIMILIVLAFVSYGCDGDQYPISSDLADQDRIELNLFLKGKMPSSVISPPADLTTVNLGSKSIEFWPYTGTNFSGAPQDPVNLIFVGQADPRDIRAALFSLDGDRSAFGLPPQAPFNSIWEDAIGNVQTAYSSSNEWTGSAIQLACGGYGPIRVHLRLFRMDDWTIANAHFELLIPGTTDHQVLSWELAKQFVTIDMLRTGLLDESIPMMPTDQINQPNFRNIPAMVYNLLPVELRGLIGGPLGDVAVDVPIAGDGHATVFNLAASVERISGTSIQDFIVDFNQVVPKPFCASGPYDYVQVEGPVHLYQESELGENGKFRMIFRAEGELLVTPINPLTGEVVGATMPAIVKESHSSSLSDSECTATSWIYQKLTPASDPNAGSLFRRLRVGTNLRNSFEENSPCR